MKQVLIFGASSVYGVGAEQGWGDLVKAYVHKTMYAQDGKGEVYEVFNFSIADTTAGFVSETYQWILEHYKREGAETIALISVGGNNAKAVDVPTRYVSTPEDFKEEVKGLLQNLKRNFTHVIFVSNGYVDEAKTNPKKNPFTGHLSYFTNERRQLFNEATKNVCDELKIDFVATDIPKEQWVATCLFRDGLHPNQEGYRQIFEAIRPVLDSYL